MNTETKVVSPATEQVIAILDNALPKIKAFQSLSYTQANRILNDEYFIDQWKGRKKAFGSLFLNLDNKNRRKILNCLKIELSEPKKQYKEEIDRERSQFSFKIEVGESEQEQQTKANFIKRDVENKFPYEFMPIEQAVVKDFCLYSLNNSRTIGKKHYINVKGAIALYQKMTPNEKVEFANTIINYY
jgi:hypothetical protein